MLYFIVTIAALFVLFALVHARISTLEGEVRRLRTKLEGEPVYGWTPARDYVDNDYD